MLKRDERGSVMMAVSVMMVLMLLTVAITDRTLSNLRSARLVQSRAAATTATDAALAEAQARIDHGEAASFAGAGTIGSTTFRYAATQNSSLSWSLRVDAIAGTTGKSALVNLTRTLVSGWVQSAWREVTPAHGTAAVLGLSGLLGYYRLDETSGTNAADLSGNGRTGTYNNTSGMTRGQVGALPLDADGATTLTGSGYVDLGNNYEFSGTGAFTLAFWIKPDVTGGAFGRVFDKDRVNPTRDGVSVNVQTSATQVAFERWANGTNNSLKVTVVPAVWNHVTFSYDGSTMRGYLNGVAAGSTTSALAITGSTTSAYLGARAATGAGSPLTGGLDEFAVWGRALSAAEVLSLYTTSTT